MEARRCLALRMKSLLDELGFSASFGEILGIERGRIGGILFLRVEVAQGSDAGSGRNQLSDHNILLQADKIVHLALDGGIGKDACRFLEGSGGEEGFGIERSLGDAEDNRTSDGRLSAVDENSSVPVGEVDMGDLPAREQVRVTAVDDKKPVGHLADDDFQVLVGDGDAVAGIDGLDFLDDVVADGGKIRAVEQFFEVDVPLRQGLSSLDLGSLGDTGDRERIRRERLFFKFVLDSENLSLAFFAHVDDFAADRCDQGKILALGVPGLEQFGDTRKTGGDVLLAGDTSSMEVLQGKLSSRFADGLGGHDADRIADFGKTTRGKVSAIAVHADAIRRIACEDGTNLDFLDSSIDDVLSKRFVNESVLRNNDFPRLRIDDVMHGEAADDAIIEVGDEFAGIITKFTDDDTMVAMAILFADDDVVGDIDKLSCQIARVGCLQGGVSTVLTSTMGRSEVFADGESVGIAGSNRNFDGSAGGVKHTALHTDELHVVVLGTSGARFHHHEHRISAGLGHTLVEHLGDRAGLQTVPIFDDGIVPLLFGEIAFFELFLDSMDLLSPLLIELVSSLERIHIVQGNGQAGLGAVIKALILEKIHDVGRFDSSVFAEDKVHHCLDALLVDGRTQRLETAVFLESIEVVSLLELAGGDDSFIGLLGRHKERIGSGREIVGIVLLGGLAVAEGEIDEGEVLREDGIEDKLSDGRKKIRLALLLAEAALLQRLSKNVNASAKRKESVLIGKDSRAGVREDLSFILLIGTELGSHLRLAALFVVLGIIFVDLDVIFEGEIVISEDHVLGRNADRLAVRGLENVLVCQHEAHGFDLCLSGKRDMDSHLVSVEVGVESRADKRMETNGLALDEDGTESLDAQSVKRRRSVEKDGMVLGDLFDGIIDLRIHSGDKLVGLPLGSDARIGIGDQSVGNERTEELDGHFTRQTALFHIEFRTDGNDGTAGIVDSLSEKVLTEASLLSFEGGGQRLQNSSAIGRRRLVSSVIVDERIDSLLKHTLLVDHDDVRGMLFHLFLETIVLDDNLTIEVVQIGSGITAAVKLHHRPQIRWNDRNHRHDHPLRLDSGILERLEDFKSLDGLDSLLVLVSRGALEILGDLPDLSIQVDFLEKFENGFGTDSELGSEILMDKLSDGEEIERLVGLPNVAQIVLTSLIIGFAILELSRLEDFIVDDLLEDFSCGLLIENLAILEDIGLTGIGDDMGDEIDDFLQLLGRNAKNKTHLGRRAFDIPDVGARESQVDVSHPFPSDRLHGDFNAALFADLASECAFLVASAMALIILDRTENLFAEETVRFRFLGSIIDGLGLGDLALSPGVDFFRAGKSDLDGLQLVEIKHFNRPP